MRWRLPIRMPAPDAAARGADETHAAGEDHSPRAWLVAEGVRDGFQIPLGTLRDWE